MKQETYPVRPLGKYGHTYLLNKKTNWWYRACLIGLVVLLVAIGETHIIGSQRYSSWPISNNEFYLFLPIYFFIGIKLLLTIAQRGRIGTSKEKPYSDPVIKGAQNSMRLVAWVGGGIFTILLGTAILHSLEMNQKIAPGVWFLFVFFVIATTRCFYLWSRERK